MEAEPANDGNRTTIWQELDRWAQDLQPWECFILEKIVRERRVSDTDIDEAYQHFLAAFGLTDPAPAQLQQKARITGRPADVAPVPIWLNKIENLQHVNALPDVAKLTFDRGLTVVYGRNGAGKSGFVRVLTNACFSRNPAKILPNVYQEQVMTAPSAELTFLRGNGQDEVVQWSAEAQYDEAKRLSVFDTSVAKTHLAGQTPFEFKPQGFDVFPELVRVFSSIESRLDSDIETRTNENKFIKIFVGDESNVSSAVAILSADTDLGELRQLAVYGESEQARLDEVDRQIKELQTKSAADALKSLEEAKSSIASLDKKLKDMRWHITADKRQEYQTKLDDFQRKTREAKTLGSESFRAPFFKSVGSDEWQHLIEAAKDLGALENDEYPQEQDHCLLCHRPLDGPSLALIRRLWAFLASDVQHGLAVASAALDGIVENLKGMRTDIFLPDSLASKHLTRLAPPLAKKVAEAIAAIETIRSATSRVLEKGDGELVFEEPANLSNELEALVDHIEADEQRLRETDVTKALQSLCTEHVTLRHRQVLSRLIGDVEAFVLDLQWARQAGGKPKNILKTRRITDKETAVSELIIGQDYRLRLEEECKKLDCDLPIELKAHGRKGQTLRSLYLGGQRPEHVLSEGEQRAVALADFLTEISLNPASAGVILDDPVNSQDHQRKKLIAKRLVEEARRRQVIVFTHDMVFLTNLLTAVQGTGVTCETHWVERDQDGSPGQVTLDDCPASMPQYQKVDKAIQTLNRAKALSGRQRAEAVMQGMAELRRVVEELVPKFLLKEVVTRWSDRIIVTAIKRINWDNGLADEIVATYENLSAYIEGHSHTDEQIGAPPELGDLETRIEIVRGLIKRAKADRPKQNVSDAA